MIYRLKRREDVESLIGHLVSHIGNEVTLEVVPCLDGCCYNLEVNFVRAATMEDARG